MIKEPEIEVGILQGKSLTFFLKNPYRIAGNSKLHIGEGRVEKNANGECVVIIRDEEIAFEDSIVFEPENPQDASFELKDVLIGIDFHWERKELQRFKGKLKLMAEADKLIAVNKLPLEDYLLSVISSEMSASSSLELLKAHAVISRSWLLAQKEKSKLLKEIKKEYQSTQKSEDELIRWYDREDHELFDVCADDHCQRYQGILRLNHPGVYEAIQNTRGEVLTYEGAICDARFSKCCGGISESFENVWGEEQYPYLKAIYDNKEHSLDRQQDLRIEKNAEKWIRQSPSAFCNTQDKKILAQVLNNYDQETSDFYRWQLTYTQAELAEIISQRSSIDFGDILELIPLERGESGRIIRLKIVGSKRTLIVGKELEIRKWFSRSHLYSSAFVIDYAKSKNTIPDEFVLTGAGWGHGVGLCQIGAAVMGAKGYDYKEILSHYFQDAELKRIY